VAVEAGVQVREQEQKPARLQVPGQAPVPSPVLVPAEPDWFDRRLERLDLRFDL